MENPWRLLNDHLLSLSLECNMGVQKSRSQLNTGRFICNLKFYIRSSFKMQLALCSVLESVCMQNRLPNPDSSTSSDELVNYDQGWALPQTLPQTANSVIAEVRFCLLFCIQIFWCKFGVALQKSTSSTNANQCLIK